MTYNDPPEIETGDIDALTPQLLGEPLERAAIALYCMGHMTPEDVGVLLARQDPSLVKAWCGGPGVREGERHLYRRRAAMVLDAHGLSPNISKGSPSLGDARSGEAPAGLTEEEMDALAHAADHVAQRNFERYPSSLRSHSLQAMRSGAIKLRAALRGPVGPP